MEPWDAHTRALCGLDFPPDTFPEPEHEDVYGVEQWAQMPAPPRQLLSPEQAPEHS